MTRGPVRLREQFDRIARLTTVEQPDRLEPSLLARLPARCAAALDVGCGTGSMTRRLAGRAGRVVGLDLSPVMIELARTRARDLANVEFVVGDVMTADLPRAGFDVVVAVSSLHHLPWEPAIARMRELLRPGGTLAVIELAAIGGPGDLVRAAASWTWRTLAQRRSRPDPACRRAWDEHARGERYLSPGAARRRFRRLLPGAEVRAHLFFRWSLLWRKPVAGAALPRP